MKPTAENIKEKVVRLFSENKTEIPFLHIFSSSGKDILLPRTELPYLYVVLNGTLQMNFPDRCLTCRGGDYFISDIVTPLKGTLSDISPDNEFWAVSVEFYPDEIISVLLEMEKTLLDKIFQGSSAEDNFSKISECLSNLLNLDKEMTDNAFLLTLYKRELIFFLLTGKYGKGFIQNTFNLKEAGKIYQINSWIKENYKNSFSVENLARQANMSVSGFHQKFKSAVGMGPIQCQKKLRLIEARNLMFRNGLSVTSASLEVGYESLSQFNRDYRQIFGETPKKDIKNLQNHLKLKGTE